MKTLSKPSNLSDAYWSGLSPQAQEMYGIVRPLPKAAYTVDNQLGYLESFIDRQTQDIEMMGGTFELDPDFQRGHVWTSGQQISYMESLLRESAPTSILFNCPGWTHDRSIEGDIPNHTFQCIDGLQRLTAARRFMADEFLVFGKFTATELMGTPFDPKRYRFQFSVYEFAHRAELLQFYLDLNGGGTVHSESELDRVRLLRNIALERKKMKKFSTIAQRSNSRLERLAFVALASFSGVLLPVFASQMNAGVPIHMVSVPSPGLALFVGWLGFVVGCVALLRGRNRERGGVGAAMVICFSVSIAAMASQF